MEKKQILELLGIVMWELKQRNLLGLADEVRILRYKTEKEIVVV